jgi:hypothetical protein
VELKGSASIAMLLGTNATAGEPSWIRCLCLAQRSSVVGEVAQ